MINRKGGANILAKTDKFCSNSFSFFDRSIIVKNDNKDMAWKRVCSLTNKLSNNKPLTPQETSWLAFILKKEGTKMQTERFLRKDYSFPEEEILRKLYFAERAESVGIEMDMIEGAVEYDKKFYSGNTADALFVYEESNELQLHAGDKKTINLYREIYNSKKAGAGSFVLTEKFIIDVCRKCNNVGTYMFEDFVNKSLTSPDDISIKASWIMADEFADAAGKIKNSEAIWILSILLWKSII